MLISATALQTIENLYVLQVDLQKLVTQEIGSAEQKRDAKAKLRDFRSLLRQADPDYMGGEDVVESLKELEEQVAKKVQA